MSLKKDVIGAEVQIGSNEAQKSLSDLAQKTSTLANENDRLRISQAKLKALGKESSEEYKKVTAAIAANSKEIKGNQSQMDALRKTIGLSDMSMKQLKTQALNLRRELSSMNQSADPARWEKLNNQLKATENQIQKVGSQIGNTKGTVNSLAEQAKGLLPAFGFAAIASAAGYAFDKIINITDTLGTKWEATVNGMNEGLNEFYRTVATGDWSNFLTRIDEAIRMGKDYVNTLDDIEEKTRSLSVVESESRAKELELEETLKNKTLSKAERIKAGQERIDLEKELAGKRTKVAQEAFDNEANLTAQQTKLTKDQLMIMLRDIDSETKIRAQQYNAVRESYKKGGFTEKELNNNLVINKDVTDSVKAYASVLRSAGNTTDEQMNKMVDAYVRLMEAQNSAKENTKKVTTSVNSLLAGEEENGNKIEDKVLKAKKEASDKAIELLNSENNKRVAILATQYTTEGMTDAKFKAEQELLDVQYLLKKQSILAENGQSTVDVDKQINDKRIQAQKDFNDEMTKVYAENDKNYSAPDLSSADMGIDPASMVTPEDLEFASKKHSLDEWTAYLIEKTNEQIKIKQKAISDENQIQTIREQLVDAQIGGIEQIAGAMAGMFEEGSAAQIAFFAIEKAMAIAQVWINYARESSAIAVTAAEMNAVSFGVAGTAWAAIMQPKALATAGLNTGLIVAQAIAQVAKGSKQSGGFAETAASDSTPVGTYHANEFIGSAPSARNPSIRQVYNIIDLAQKQGRVATLNLPAVMASMGMLPNGRQSGGFASSSTSTTNTTILTPSSSGISDDIAKKLIDVLENWDPAISIELLERRQNLYNKITNGGLK